MLTILSIVLPIFALIFAGWLVRRLGVLGSNATSELNRFVVYLALPALLFDIVAKAHWSEIWLPGFIAAFGLGCCLLFVFTVWVRYRQGGHLADAAIDGLNASYANTGFIGFPLAAAVIGPSALAPTFIAALLTVCVLFGMALMLVEIGMQAKASPFKMAGKVGLSLARNPLLISPVLGAVFMLLDINMPVPMDSFLKLLGGAAPPCALVALGLFLAEKREAAQGNSLTVASLTGLKLIAQPLLTWWLAARIFHLSHELTVIAVMLAALPTGTGSFMAAEFYRREAMVTSRVILVSTVISLVTISVYLGMALN